MVVLRILTNIVTCAELHQNLFIIFYNNINNINNINPFIKNFKNICMFKNNILFLSTQ